jgi:hypothetical protein
MFTIRVYFSNIDVDDNFFIFTDNLIINETFLESNCFSEEISLREKIEIVEDKSLKRFQSFSVIACNNKMRKLNVILFNLGRSYL